MERLRHGCTIGHFELHPEKQEFFNGLLRKTLTLNNGSGMAGFKELESATKLNTYFCKPYSPWQRGANENGDGLLRQYFPRGTSFHKITEKMLVKTVKRLNNRPRKCLDCQTPAEVFN